MANGHGGARRNAGAKLGVQRVDTQRAHEAIALAFERIGGVDALVTWAKENQGAFYERVWPKIIPAQLTVQPGQGGSISVTWQPPQDV